MTVSQEIRRQILDRVRNGATYAEAAGRQVNPRTVQRWAQEAGIQSRRSLAEGCAGRNWANALTPREREKAREMRRAGRTYRQIADAFDVAITTARKEVLRGRGAGT